MHTRVRTHAFICILFFLFQKPGKTSANSSDSESDDISEMTIASQLGKSPKLETVV